MEPVFTSTSNRHRTLIHRLSAEQPAHPLSPSQVRKKQFIQPAQAFTHIVLFSCTPFPSQTELVLVSQTSILFLYL